MPKPSNRRLTIDELTYLRLQAESLRTSGVRNRQIAAILHVSLPIVYDLVGKQPAELRKPRVVRSDKGRVRRPYSAPRHPRPLGVAVAAYHGTGGETTYYKDADDMELRRRLSTAATYELHESSSESMIHPTSDLLAAIREASENGVNAYLDDDGVHTSSFESDDVRWRDEAEPLPDELPDERWYARLAGWHAALLRFRRMSIRRVGLKSVFMGEYPTWSGDNRPYDPNVDW
jgi:hypothetical protein